MKLGSNDVNNFKLGGNDVDKIMLGTIEVWSAELPAGNVIIDYNAISGDNPDTVSGANGTFTFTVPDGVTEVNICLIGGGGSGSVTAGTHAGTGYGGYAGTIVTTVQAVTPNTQYGISIGQGGEGVFQLSSSRAGNSGNQSTFNGLKADGGAGGSFSGYQGQGAPVNNCFGSFNDGNSSGTLAYGGQGGFSNGTNGASATNNPTSSNAVRGAGSGGARASNSGARSGDGGNGVCMISWGGVI